MVVFGASGDLMGRELAPAIHSLLKSHALDSSFRAIGVAKDHFDDKTFRSELFRRMERGPRGAAKGWTSSARHFSYLRGDLRRAGTYSLLARELDPDKEGDVLFYLAVPPNLFTTVLRQLRKCGLTAGTGGWRRVVLEKPFGVDSKSCRELETEARAAFGERQVYRMDHVLGMTPVEDISALRSANLLIGTSLSTRFVDCVQIMMDETLGVEGRGEYYDRAGVLRDMVQNHLFQLLSTLAMEPPTDGDEGSARANVLRKMRPISPKEVVLGQYAGYPRELHVRRGSRTPTYAAVKVWIDSDRWRGVPFYLRTGKKLARKATEILVKYKTGIAALAGAGPGYLLLRAQPEQRICVGFEVALSVARARAAPVELCFDYQKLPGDARHGAYESLLLDAMSGNRARFVSSEFEELAWKRIDPIVRLAGTPSLPLRSYLPGTRGPDEASSLLGDDGRAWGTSST